jgi:hypothetical protein
VLPCLSHHRRREETFFASHPEYRDVAAHCGVNNLARRLNAILVEHIRGLLPGLRRRIHEALEVRAPARAARTPGHSEAGLGLRLRYGWAEQGQGQGPEQGGENKGRRHCA